jgi:hypothetical protein
VSEFLRAFDQATSSKGWIRCMIGFLAITTGLEILMLSVTDKGIVAGWIWILLGVYTLCSVMAGVLFKWLRARGVTP